MSKTMKMLFCSICCIYDCGQHSLDDNMKDVIYIVYQKQYQYISPKNKISQKQKLRTALTMVYSYKDLIEKN